MKNFCMLYVLDRKQMISENDEVMIFSKRLVCVFSGFVLIDSCHFLCFAVTVVNCSQNLIKQQKLYVASSAI